jgi:extracellular elastinolytic metalloproteinase
MSMRPSVRRSRQAAIVAAVCALAAAVIADPGAAAPTASRPAAAAGSVASHADPVKAGSPFTGNLDTRERAAVADHSRAQIRYTASLGPFAVVAFDPLTHTPDNVSLLRGYLTARSDRSPEAIARGYVRTHAVGLGLDRSDLAKLRLTGRVADLHGVTHLSWTQEADGVPVFGNGLRAHVAADGRLLSIQGAPISGLAALADGAPPPRLDAGDAASAAAASIGVGRLASLSSAPRRVWFATASGLRPAWSTYAQSGDGAGYQQVVDAVTGRILYRNDLARFDHGDALAVRNYPGAPHGGKQQRFQVIDRGWLGKKATWLNGANAIAFADVNGDDAVQANEKTPVPGTRRGAQFRIRPFDSAPGCGPRYVCTWDPDVPFSWRKNRSEGVTQAFVLVNLFHDYLSRAPFGFTPQMGNFEANGDDPVLVNAFDGAAVDAGLPNAAHVDNASMITPPDGIPPTMQLPLFHRPGATMGQDPFLPTNSADDASIVLHEYAHGLSDRLVVDPAGNSTLRSFQAQTMAEAWSDYYALDYLVKTKAVADTAKPGEVLEARYAQRNRAISRSEAIDCPVASTARLCTKFNLDTGGYTFGDLGTTATGGPDIHGDAMIWAQTLWDLRQALGHRVVGAIVTEAMSLSPADPSFLDERDAVLAADQAVYGGADRRTIWRVFAHRGMGWAASVADAADTSAVENFSMPPRADAPRGTLSGSVVDDVTGDPIAGAAVAVGGHRQWSSVTGADGTYRIRQVVDGDYPELIVRAPGFDSDSIEVVSSAPATNVDFELRRDWAATDSGGSIADFTGPDSGSGCGPSNAIDLSASSGWSTAVGQGAPSATPRPKRIDIRLPQPVDIHSFGIDPSPACGDGASSATRRFTVEVSLDGKEYSPVATGAFRRADIGHVNEVESGTGRLPGVQYVRVWIDSPQVPAGVNCDGPQGDLYSGCSVMDLSEFEVYGRPGPPESEDAQVLSFNNLQGHLLPTDPPLSPQLDPSQTPVGGIAYLATLVKSLRATQPDATATVAAGDLIGSSPRLSAQFADQPTIDALDELGLDVSAVANLELEEGTAELRRIVGGGCLPSGCFTDPDGADIPYDGAGFDYITANVVNKADGSPFLPPTWTRVVHGIPIGFIGITPQSTPDQVDPDGVSSVDFLDEVASANGAAAALKASGVETIVVLLHGGGSQTGGYNGCANLSGPIVAMASEITPEVDLLVTGHTAVPYVCTLDDPAGNPRAVTSAGSFGRVLTETHLTIDRATREVVRPETTAQNHLVVRTVAPDPGETRVIDFWQTVAAGGE